MDVVHRDGIARVCKSLFCSTPVECGAGKGLQAAKTVRAANTVLAVVDDGALPAFVDLAMACC